MARAIIIVIITIIYNNSLPSGNWPCFNIGVLCNLKQSCVFFCYTESGKIRIIQRTCRIRVKNTRRTESRCLKKKIIFNISAVRDNNYCLRRRINCPLSCARANGNAMKLCVFFRLQELFLDRYLHNNNCVVMLYTNITNVYYNNERIIRSRYT